MRGFLPRAPLDGLYLNNLLVLKIFAAGLIAAIFEYLRHVAIETEGLSAREAC